MKSSTLLFLLLLVCTGSYGQAVFQNTGSGNWDAPASWTLLSGSSSANYPVAGDTATVTGAYTLTIDANVQCNQLTVTTGATLLFNSTASILTVSNGLSVSGVSVINLNLGVLTVTGNATESGGSTITINQGALTVIGLFTMTTPTAPSTGTTLLDVEGGAFSCLGLTTLTATVGARYSELRIAGGAVNLAGGLITSTANSRINFTGPGTLSLAGSINIPVAASFIPGTGRVIYVGIPGTNQTIAPLTYYRLVITGVGGGIKQINGAVTVTDTLTLLTDTLQVNSGGSLTLNDGVTLIRTGGQLLSTPVFAGSVDLVYNDVQRDTTGAEMPVATGVLRNLTISDIVGIQLGANATVNNNLDLQQGPLITGSYTLAVVNTAGGSGMDPGISRTNGYVLGAINRSIGATTGLRIFPLGTGSLQGYREFDLEYTTAPSVAGTLTVQDVDSSAPAQSGLPLTDNGIIIVNVAHMYWQADAGGGLSGGQYTLTLTAGGASGVSDISTLRLIKRPSSGGPWIADGTAGTNSGTNSAPVIVRTGMSGFSQFTYGSDNTNTLPVTLLSFTTRASGPDVILNWTTSGEIDNLSFTVGHSTDAQHFEDLGTLPGAGTTGLQQAYTFTQVNAPAGINYYRLRQTDIDGNTTYSMVISCVISATDLFTLFPNPASATITIHTGNNSPLRLYDESGRYIRLLSAGVNDIGGLAKGMYYIQYAGKMISWEKN